MGKLYRMWMYYMQLMTKAYKVHIVQYEHFLLPNYCSINSC